MAREVLLDDSLLDASLKVKFLVEEVHNHLLYLVVPERLIERSVRQVHVFVVLLHHVVGFYIELLGEVALGQRTKRDHEYLLAMIKRFVKSLVSLFWSHFTQFFLGLATEYAFPVIASGHSREVAKGTAVSAPPAACSQPFLHFLLVLYPLVVVSVVDSIKDSEFKLLFFLIEFYAISQIHLDFVLDRFLDSLHLDIDGSLVSISVEAPRDHYVVAVDRISVRIPLS